MQSWVKVTLWSGRSRVASATGCGIPMLELMTCVLLGRLRTEVKKAIEKEINCCLGRKCILLVGFYGLVVVDQTS